MNVTLMKNKIADRIVNKTVRTSSNTSKMITKKPTTKMYENKIHSKNIKFLKEKEISTGSFEKIDGKNINDSQKFETDLENGNETMMDYYDYYTVRL
uniref:Uncharacterized protein n=1 Tax=Meloidogyne enterolobii TaxID=390850 RepID=A0A6V7XT41_MELEN|nr:unnamed protein product [Meloidogyne enterolobii]